MLGEQIQKLRENKNLSQKQLADLVGVKTGLIAEWESGESFPDEDQLHFLSVLFKEEITSDGIEQSIPVKQVEPSLYESSYDIKKKPIKIKNFIYYIYGICALFLLISVIIVVVIYYTTRSTNWII